MGEDGFARAAELTAAALSLNASDEDGAAAVLMRAEGCRRREWDQR